MNIETETERRREEKGYNGEKQRQKVGLCWDFGSGPERTAYLGYNFVQRG